MEFDKYKNTIKDMLTSHSFNYIDFIKKRYAGKKICIWGVGNMGVPWPELFSKYNLSIDFYCDNNPDKVGKTVYDTDIMCISLEELITYKDEVAVLIPTRFYKEIYKQLKELDFPFVDRVFLQKFWIDEYINENGTEDIIAKLCDTIDVLADEESCRILCKLVSMWVLDLYEYGYLDDICSEPQYFPEDIVKKNPGEIFVDCGAFTGDIIPDFLKFESNQFEKYYAFELNRKNYEVCKHNIDACWPDLKEKFIIENKGISNISDEIYYSDECEGSRVTEEGTIKGEVVSIDDYFMDRDITFIKMDVEGMEIPALEGGMHTIGRCLPTLAICMYHKISDYWEIPAFIKQHWPEYRIFIRHHTDLMNETVCYAVK